MTALEPAPLLEIEVHTLRHALGLTHGKRAYRRFYLAERGFAIDAVCTLLVARGYMVEWEYNGSGGTRSYRVTPAGAAAVLRPGETLDAELFGR